VVQAAPADKKAWYAEKFQQQDRAEKEKFVQEPHPLVEYLYEELKEQQKLNRASCFDAVEIEK
jgi:hypothetical protein